MNATRFLAGRSARDRPNAGGDAWSAAAIADAVRARERSAGDVLDETFERLKHTDAMLGAFVLVDEVAARSAAASVDLALRQGEDPGPLAGVPVAVKDVEDVVGWPTRHGSAVTETAAASTDAPEIACLRRAGAVLIGKTTTGEFGTGYITETPLHADTANPRHPAHSAGGSSGGSAAAVAAGIVPLATGVDGGGSVRVPAAFCGVVGYKPSPDLAYGSPRDRAKLVEPGVVTATPLDALLWLDAVQRKNAIAGSSPSGEDGVAGTNGTPAKIAFVAALGDAPVDRDVASIASRAAEGFVTIEASVVPSLEAMQSDDLGLNEWMVLAGAELHEDMVRAGIWPARADELGSALRRLLRSLEGVGPIDRVWALGVQATMVARRTQIFSSIDVLVTPATAVVPPLRGGPFPPVIGGNDGAYCGPAPFSPLANMWGGPAVVVPAGKTTDGLPVGIQLLGAPGSDRSLLRVAATMAHTAGVQ